MPFDGKRLSYANASDALFCLLIVSCTKSKRLVGPNGMRSWKNEWSGTAREPNVVAQVIEEYNKTNPCRAPPAPEEGPGLNLVKSRVYTIPEEVTDEEDLSSASDRQCKHKASCCHGQVCLQTHFPPSYLISRSRRQAGFQQIASSCTITVSKH